MSEREMIFLESGKVVKRAGSLQMTIPAGAGRLINLKDGDRIFVLYDLLRPGQLIILKPSEVTLSRDIRYNIADEEKTILRILEESKAYLPEGHYKLASLRHSNRYVHVRLALARDDCATLCGQRVADKFRDDNIALVAGFTVGGILLAQTVSASFDEKAEPLIGKMEKRSNTDQKHVFFEKKKLDEIGKDARILVVDDVLTTGGTICAAINTLQKYGKGEIVGVAVVVDRSDSAMNPFSNLEIKSKSLIRIGLDTYEKKECPLCRQGIAIKDMSRAEIDPFSVVGGLPKEYQTMMSEKYEKVRKMQEAIQEWVS